MSNDIDTAAIRAEYEVGLWPNAGTCRVIGELCDALDEARAERDGWKLAAGHRKELLIEREERIEELESRIAKLEICSGNGQYIPAAAVRRMLNGD